MNKDRLKTNIRSLRLAYGETQESLGASISVEKNSISNYENGIREPDKDTLKEIANHFVVTVDDLLNKDFSYLGKINLDSQWLTKKIYELLPILSSENALRNTSFKKAIKAHRSFYEKVKKNREDGIELLVYGMVFYTEAMDDPNAKIESAANYLSLLFFIIMYLKGTIIAFHQIAAIKQIRKSDRKVDKILDDLNDSFYEETKNVLTQMYQSEDYCKRTELLFLLKREGGLSDLADYYLALQYCWGILDNEMGMALNQKIGYEMMSSFSLAGNYYAKRFLQLFYDAQSDESSRSVDDKKKRS